MPDQVPIESARAPAKYGDAEGYDSYMGGWSAALAPLFLTFAAVGRVASLLDVGSGTGNLLAAASTAMPGTRLVGVDPSKALSRKARQRPELAHVAFADGGAEALPFTAGTFDCCLSLLVLQEFPDLPAALGEMRRVTRPGGIVAACVWDFSRMPVIAVLVDAIAAVDPKLGNALAASAPPQIADEAGLARCWSEAGFAEVSAGRIAVARRFRDFDQVWRPLLAGSTPSTLTLAALPAPQRDAVQSIMRRRLAETPLGVSVVAEALVVRGRA
jgi:SAM-dependent methyltransferase